ncbi:Nucleoside diphosphate-linked moiety X motif 19, mitochondrial [Boothiomyces macroporosus]|uniref:Nucleoside diphosphate-linked moiety X motif 19, mitochondrial n=1 Tax=Boothiomyces macroporosus TaxID=261099 RepID=A0AAD5UMK7_9FUNG|nr:Nucleoside diphosphate-linked moiety X motif 19, mitochondrial [Boothiomyces macroporosus]
MTIRKAGSLIVLAKEAGSKFKVLLLQRSSHGYFGGLAVFPGGAVHPSDANPDYTCLLPKQQRSWFKTHSNYAIAALRETFEEAGLLLLDPWVKLTKEENLELRKKVLNDPTQFISISRTLLRVPILHKLIYWSNWVSPLHMEKHRFDTHFFLTVINQEQKQDLSLEADGRETLKALWMTPEEALEAYSRKELKLLPPQYCTLKQLCETSIDDLEKEIQDIKSNRKVPAYMPEFLRPSEDGGGIFALPGDKEYSKPGEFENRLIMYRKDGKVDDIKWLRSKL